MDSPISVFRPMRLPLNARTAAVQIILVIMAENAARPVMSSGNVLSANAGGARQENYVKMVKTWFI